MKKSLYVYLTSLLGILLFLTLHRIAIFAYLLLASMRLSPFVENAGSIEFVAWEFFTLIIAMLLGGWYGIWVGQYWFEKVYVENSHPGLVGHLADKLWPRKKSAYDLEKKIKVVEKKLEADLWKLEELAEAAPVVAAAPAPVRKSVVRKRTTKKVTKTT